MCRWWVNLTNSSGRLVYRFLPRALALALSILTVGVCIILMARVPSYPAFCALMFISMMGEGLHELGANGCELNLRNAVNDDQLIDLINFQGVLSSFHNTVPLPCRSSTYFSQAVEWLPPYSPSHLSQPLTIQMDNRATMTRIQKTSAKR